MSPGTSRVDAVRVVVAEDEAIIRLDLVESLRVEGYDVVADTGRGDEVMSLVRAHRPDVVILDVKMPGRDGIDVAGEIAAERLAAAVMLTAFGQRELVTRATEAGVMVYLVKPYRRDDLVPAVELALARFREHRALEDQLAELEERLETRKLVERAKGRLMDERGLPEAEAFSFLQLTAMSRRCPMRDVARDVLDGSLAP